MNTHRRGSDRKAEQEDGESELGTPGRMFNDLSIDTMAHLNATDFGHADSGDERGDSDGDSDGGGDDAEKGEDRNAVTNPFEEEEMDEGACEVFFQQHKEQPSPTIAGTTTTTTATTATAAATTAAAAAATTGAIATTTTTTIRSGSDCVV
jgi:hypothetical protein